MSNLFQSDIFRILNDDHQRYLQPYDYQKNRYRYDDIATECEDLAKKIASLCSVYTRNIDEECFEKAAVTIKTFLKSCKDRRIFREVKNHLLELRNRNPVIVLKQVNYIHSQVFDMNHFKLVFRLDGNEFPPIIVYNIRPKIDLNIVSLRTNVLIVSDNKYIYNTWFQYKAYKCHTCKTYSNNTKLNSCRSERYSLRSKRKTSKINWIERLYFD